MIEQTHNGYIIDFDGWNDRGGGYPDYKIYCKTFSEVHEQLREYFEK